jgi:hypothetical protein
VRAKAGWRNGKASDANSRVAAWYIGAGGGEFKTTGGHCCRTGMGENTRCPAGPAKQSGPWKPPNKKAPEVFRPPRLICGSGRSSRALSRWHTLGRARFRGRCASRRHSPRHADVSVSWRDRSDRCRPESSSEASSPGSDAPCRERRAGRGADTPAILMLSRRHRCHGDGASFWLAVGPALRV